MSEIKKQWSNREEAYRKTMAYLTGRFENKITSLQTPWPRYNAAGVNGWEWGTAIAICARPGVGKTVQVDELCRKVYNLNPNVTMRILKFELEMLSQVTVIREFSSVLKKSYAYVCNAEYSVDSGVNDEMLKRKISKEELIKCWEHVQRKIVKKENGDMLYPEDIVETAPTVKEFEKIIDDYMLAHMVEGEYTKVLVTIDHLRLFMCEIGESEQKMLYNVSLTINRLKKKYGNSIIFVALNHLLRTVSDDSRTENGKASNYLRDSDIFGADAIMQNFDIVVIKDRPANRNITHYGPRNYVIHDDRIIVDQFVKVRNGSPGMSWSLGEFDKMQIIEIDTPQTAEKRLNTR